jgi:hypothetical protein
MTFEVVSTSSWNVLGTFEDEDDARRAVASLVSESDRDIHDLIVYRSTDDGQPDGELDEAHGLSVWAGLSSGRYAIS